MCYIKFRETKNKRSKQWPKIKCYEPYVLVLRNFVKKGFKKFVVAICLNEYMKVIQASKVYIIVIIMNK